MRLLSRPDIEQPHDCAYFPGLQSCRFRYFFADNVSEEELNILLSSGWRKFSNYYFRPDCVECRRCIPIRIPVHDFMPSKSQRRVINKCSAFMVRFKPLEFRQEIYAIYHDHKVTRFGGTTNLNDFIASFYTPSCPSIQSEYYLGDTLAGVGFIDVSSEALSSVYMVYSSPFEKYRPGTYSIIKEIEFARDRGLNYYYLGYYIERNRSMAYKNNFYPHELYDWEKEVWVRVEKK